MIELQIPTTSQLESAPITNYKSTQIRNSVLMMGIGSQIPIRLLRWAGYEIFDPSQSPKPNQKVFQITDPNTQKVYYMQCNCADGSNTEASLHLKYLSLPKLLLAKILLK